MGIQDHGRLSLKRLSVKLDDVARKVKKAGVHARIPGAIQQHGNEIWKNKRPVSQVSEIGETDGTKLGEANALTEEGFAVVTHIAEFLQRRVESEDRVNNLDKFAKSDGRVPPVALDAYLIRLARYVNVWSGHRGGAESAGVRAAVMAAMYLNKLEEFQPHYALNKFNVHRLVMTAFLVATKFTEDYVISNDFWAKVGGVKTAEVNKLEGSFCNMMRFELYLDEEGYAQVLEDFSY